VDPRAPRSAPALSLSRGLERPDAGSPGYRIRWRRRCSRGQRQQRDHEHNPVRLLEALRVLPVLDLPPARAHRQALLTGTDVRGAPPTGRGAGTGLRGERRGRCSPTGIGAKARSKSAPRSPPPNGANGKPFGYPELRFRVQALLRRAHLRRQPSRVRVGELEVDVVARAGNARTRRPPGKPPRSAERLALAGADAAGPRAPAPSDLARGQGPAIQELAVIADTRNERVTPPSEERPSMRKILTVVGAALAVAAVATPASAEARSCGGYRTFNDGTKVKVDAYYGASCSFARAAASRFYAVAGVPRHMKVRGTRLTYRRKEHGRGWVFWAYGGRRYGRVAVVIISQQDPPPSTTPASPSPVSPPPTTTQPVSPPPTTTQPVCDPNYQGACLNPYAYDYDCLGGSGDGPFYTGQVTIVGYDRFGLDADGDGIGCEWS
jgi:hypothetical protein